MIDRKVTPRDDIHIPMRKVFGYQKPFNAIISEREPGKSTEAWSIAWDFFKKGFCTIAFRRHVIDVTEMYIEDSMKILHKFYAEFDIKKIHYKKGSLKEGVVDVFYGENLFFRLIGLSKSLSSLKSLFVQNLRLMVFDEFICNPRASERYLKNEAFKFKEVFNTFQRESNGNLTCLFLGNPYSLYNPYFSWWGVNTKELKPGAFISPKDQPWLVWCYQMNPKLREKILERNPLYKFDDDYKKYAFNGLAINDTNIRLLDKQPPSYKLIFAINVEGKMLGIFRNQEFFDLDNKYYVREIVTISERKNIFCFSFDDLQDRACLVSNEDRENFIQFKDAFRKRQINYQTIEDYYLIEDIYLML